MGVVILVDTVSMEIIMILVENTHTHKNEQNQIVGRFWYPGKQKQSDLFIVVTLVSREVHGTELVLTK